MEKISVAIVDDQNLFRQSLALLINSVEEFTLVTDSAGGQEFLNTLKTTTAPVDVAVIDMDMPGMNGIELNKALHEQYPGIKVIILSVHVNEALITKMINAGAASYLAKNCDKDELILAINTVYKTGFYFNNDALNAIRNSANHRNTSQTILSGLQIALTRREKQVLELICKEFNNAEIADQLYLSVRTVEGHRNNLIIKTNCRNTAGLVLFAIKFGLFEIPF
ncbi:response regulator transcription factor [Mucilaginibacter sp. ZT4R22]|uniref:Response regulator transcription factor n=1 Tax=Mucilaginibacter pankratovii TaxID=2772110 RepID=A0ABR7WLQ8_9SPHI|nr:response regulator transcription factor [Mucilaginibacter pankratovii]MBD1363256.1 response regulator transcription factor [Mucilaginibacter pankratovii]